MGAWSQILLSNTPGLRFDPEYYQPYYLDLSAKLNAVNPITIDSFAYVTDGIHGSPQWVEDGGITYLSAKCVKDNYFILTEAGQISQEQNDLNPRTQTRVGDVLLTTVGTIGNAAVVYEDILPANMDRHLGIIRVRNDKKAIDPYYLATFLNSKFGRFQTLREATGNVQLNLFIEKIKKLLVPLGDRFNEVGQMTREAYGKLRESELIYKKAEGLLLGELGLNNVDISHQTTYSAKFNETLKVNRLDAEYFQPKYQRMLDLIQKTGQGFRLGDWVIEPIKRGIQPGRHPDCCVTICCIDAHKISSGKAALLYLQAGAIFEQSTR